LERSGIAENYIPFGVERAMLELLSWLWCCEWEKEEEGTVEPSELLKGRRKGLGIWKRGQKLNSRGLDCEDPRAGPRAGRLI
jgi:hypothetical protein